MAHCRATHSTRRPMHHDNPYRPPLVTRLDSDVDVQSHASAAAPRPIAVWAVVVLATIA